MNKQMLMVNSITYAIKGRNILRANGIKAYVERTSSNLDRVGCGYSIYVYNGIDEAERILKQNGIKIIGRNEVESA